MTVRNRLDKLEQRRAAEVPVVFIMGAPLARGERPKPGAFTFTLDDPRAERQEEGADRDA